MQSASRGIGPTSRCNAALRVLKGGVNLDPSGEGHVKAENEFHFHDFANVSLHTSQMFYQYMKCAANKPDLHYLQMSSRKADIDLPHLVDN